MLRLPRDRGGSLVCVFFASSKTCSGCGWGDQYLTLSDRTFRCQACGLIIDRDLNAAKNLEMLAESSSDRLNACGEGSAGDGLRSAVKLPSLKQEPNPFDASAENGTFWRTVRPCLLTAANLGMA